MRRKIARLLCGALLVSLLAGCSDGGEYVPTGDALEGASQPTDATEMTAPGTLTDHGAVFTLAYYPEEGFNPYQCTNINNRLLFSLLYQGLFSVDRDYNVEPMLCQRYTVTEDLKTYTFYLEAATYPDGTQVQATDVVTSLKAARNSDYYGGRFTHVDSITEAGGNAVRIELDCALETLPMLLDIPIVKYGQEEESMPQGTGPYVLKYTSTGLTLQKRDNWWCTAALPLEADTIPMIVAESATQIRDAFEFDDLGISTADPGAASYAEYRCDYELWEAESGVFLYLGCNLASSVFSNSQVRLALSFAIDRSELLNECYNGFGITTTLPASPNSPFYDKGLASQVTYDPTRLQKALADANMTGKTVRLLVNKSDSVRLQTARRIARMLSDCGLTVEVLEYSSSEYRSVLRTDDWDLYLGQTKLSPNMDLSAFFHEKGALSYGEMNNEACYDMCLEALENSGNYYNLHEMILRNGQLVPILFRTYSVYADRGLAQELAPARDNVFWYSLGKSLSDARSVLTDTE